jgi:hypothetical protein
MATTAAKVIPMTPKRVDQLGERWNQLKLRQEQLDKEFEECGAEILACVEAQGQLAERASKTRVVDGLTLELRATYGEETRIDQKGALAFLEACPKVIGAQVFRREEKFVLVQTPDRIEGGAELPIAVRRLFQEAVKVKPRAPKIEVRSKIAET